MAGREIAPLALACAIGVAGAGAEPWLRHTIDASSKGADGVRLADLNGDGLQDIATGWEQGGVIRVCIHPGADKSKALWPAVTVGKVKDSEDAVFADLDGDGRLDVVSCCEGGTRTVFVHWAPKDGEKLLESSAWKTAAFPATERKESWMYALPEDIDGKDGIDLFVSSKGKGGSVSWLQSPAGDRRELSKWRLHRLYDAGWIMSLEAADLDGDGDRDLIVSDRKGAKSGVLWLEHPGAEAAAKGAPWNEHRIGAGGLEVMFLRRADLDGDGLIDIACTTRNGKVVTLRRLPGEGVRWEERSQPNPGGLRAGKSLALGDLDGDGRLDMATTSRPNAKGDACVHWRRWAKSPLGGDATDSAISDATGSKFDLIELIDLDGDGDLDLLTCEEAANLGVFWYENPLK